MQERYNKRKILIECAGDGLRYIFTNNKSKRCSVLALRCPGQMPVQAKPLLVLMLIHANTFVDQQTKRHRAWVEELLYLCIPKMISKVIPRF